MSGRERFLSQFAPLPEGIALPERISAEYDAESCLAPPAQIMIKTEQILDQPADFLIVQVHFSFLRPKSGYKIEFYWNKYTMNCSGIQEFGNCSNAKKRSQIAL